MRARASGRISRTLAITAAIVMLLAGTAWWLWQPDASPDAAASRWPAYTQGRPSAQDGRGMSSTPETPATTGRVIADHNATLAPGAKAAKSAPRSSDVPSGAASPAATTATTGAPEFEEEEEEEEEPGVPRYWHRCGGGGSPGVETYRFASDRSNAAQGGRSGSIASRVPSPAPAFAGFCQHVSAQQYRGKRVAYSAFLRTDKAVPGAQLLIRADALDGRVVAFANMFNRHIPGTTPWARHTIVIDIPEDAAAIMVGAALLYTGALWIDEAALEIVDESWPLTDKAARKGARVASPLGLELPPAILNPGFEETAALKLR
jgi:hypothetical protein